MNRVWLITGANSGFGRAITEAAVSGGDTALFANITTSRVIDDYAATVGPARRMTETSDGRQPGDPAKAAAAILAALDAEQTPLRLPLGDDAVDAVLGHLDSVVDAARIRPEEFGVLVQLGQAETVGRVSLVPRTKVAFAL